MKIKICKNKDEHETVKNLCFYWGNDSQKWRVEFLLIKISKFCFFCSFLSIVLLLFVTFVSDDYLHIMSFPIVDGLLILPMTVELDKMWMVHPSIYSIVYFFSFNVKIYLFLWFVFINIRYCLCMSHEPFAITVIT